MDDFILRVARQAVETYVRTGKKMSLADYPDKLEEKKGVFVTLYKRPKELRGCIGFPYPQLPLINALIEAATEACRDPRFPPLSKEELKDVRIEVSVLSVPEQVKVKAPKDYLKAIKPRKDGLIIQKGFFSGLLLPQVWEELPKKEDFLEALCMKAGLLADEWLDPSTKIYRFSVKAFTEL